jgi:hypothetical protein
MRPPGLNAWLAAAVLAAVAGCGSPAPKPFHPAGTIPAPQNTGPSSTGYLTGPVPFPGQLTFRFDALPADPQQAALVATDRKWLYAYYYAIYTHNAHGSYTSYISNSGSLQTTMANVELAVVGHRGYAGVLRYFGTTVTPVTSYPGELSVNYCVDQSGLHLTDIRTGSMTGPPSTPYYVEHDWFARDSHGTWKVVGTQVIPYSPASPPKECSS